MWQIPRPLLDRGDDQALLKFVLAQLQDPEAFLGKVRALYQSDAESADNLQFKDGRVFECKSFPLILNHAVLGRVWSFSDATARIQAAEALRAGEERFRDLAIMSSDWFWEQDTEFRFIVMSEDLARKATLSPASTIGKTRWELPVEGVSEAQWNVHRAMLQNREPIEDFVYQLRNDVGELRSFSITGKPVFGPDGAFRGYRGTGRDVTVQKVEEDRIQHVAHHDSLTGLPNRLLFRDRLGQATSVAKRDSRQLALLYLDLDKFKQVNDTLGHDAGDQVLQLVAERIREQVRESDTIARLGGDEFAVIVRDILNRQDVETVAGKIAAAISAPMNLPNQPRAVEIGCSIGIAVYPVDAQDQENLIHVADAAMYETKRNASAKRRN
jgi:diguanylate cyclase (GGDEF)-like protein/PAS domain S-box-containing protein